MGHIEGVREVARDPISGEHLQHFGPDSRFSSGAENVHATIVDKSLDKTIAAVYLGDDKRFRAIHPENAPPDGIFRSEYLAFEFTDGTSLVIQIGSGNTFHVPADREANDVLTRAKTAAGERASS